MRATWLIFTWTLCAAAAVAQPAMPGRPIGAELSARVVDGVVQEAAERGTLRDLAQSLARARVPVGVVLSAEDMGRFPVVRGKEVDRPPVALGLALDTFVERTRAHAAREHEGVVILLPARMPACASGLSRRIARLDSTAAAFALQYELVRAANDDRSPFIPPGLVGAGPSSLDESRPRDEDDGDLYRTRVTLKLRDTTLIDALNAIVTQVPGLGWALVERFERPSEAAGESRATGRRMYCTVDLLAPNGMTSGGWSLKAP